MGWYLLCVNGVCPEHLQDEPTPPHWRAAESSFQYGLSVLNAMCAGSFFPLKEPCLTEQSRVSGDVLLILDPLLSSGCLSTAEPKKWRYGSFCTTDGQFAAVWWLACVGAFSKGNSCVFLNITFGKQEKRGGWGGVWRRKHLFHNSVISLPGLVSVTCCKRLPQLLLQYETWQNVSLLMKLR